MVCHFRKFYSSETQLIVRYSVQGNLKKKSKSFQNNIQLIIDHKLAYIDIALQWCITCLVSQYVFWSLDKEKGRPNRPKWRQNVTVILTIRACYIGAKCHGSHRFTASPCPRSLSMAQYWVTLFCLIIDILGHWPQGRTSGDVTHRSGQVDT